MKLRYYLLTAAYCAAIFWLSAQPFDDQPALEIPGLDKAIHMLIYGGLAGIVSAGLRRSGRDIAPSLQFFVPLFFAMAYGLSDEIHQYFVPNRNFDPLDVVADALGALTVQAILCLGRWHIAPRALWFRP